MRRPKAGDIWRWTRDDAETDEQRLHEVMDPSIYAKNARNWIRVPVKLISTGEKFNEYVLESWEDWHDCWEFVSAPYERICPACNRKREVPDDDYLCVACRSAT